MKHSENILIQGLPSGKYAVREDPLEGYDSSFNGTNTGFNNSVTVQIENAKTTELLCRNTYPVYYGYLNVKKVVANAAENSATDQAPADDIFTFEVEITNYDSKITLGSGVTATLYNSEDAIVNKSSILPNITVKDGVDTATLTFTLAKDQWISLNLPACSYSIKEVAVGKSDGTQSRVPTVDYDVACTLNNVSSNIPASATMGSNDVHTVVFTNTYKQHFGELIIDQSGMRDGNESAVYELVNSSNQTVLTFAISGNKSVTLKNVPVDVYTVREIASDWTWTYANARQTVPNVAVQADTETEVDMVYEAKTVDWLHAEAHN